MVKQGHTTCDCVKTGMGLAGIERTGSGRLTGAVIIVSSRDNQQKLELFCGSLLKVSRLDVDCVYNKLVFHLRNNSVNLTLIRYCNYCNLGNNVGRFYILVSFVFLFLF